MKHVRLFSLVLILTLELAWLPTQSVRANTYIVTNTLDSGAGSLRWAINNANTNPGADTIEFDIIVCDGVCVITLSTPLPTLTDDSTTIDGYAQPGATPASGVGPATILIEIDGSNITNNNGLNILSANNLVRGLAINRFGYNGIAIGYSEAAGNVIEGNYLGVDAGGTLDRGNGLDGVFIGSGAIQNTIGGDSYAEVNVIAGNGWAGVSIHGADTNGNTVSGNYIGMDKTGLNELGNSLDGVWIYGGAHDNTVGGDIAQERNQISGNLRDGVRLQAGRGNVVSGNIIGLTPTGTAGNVGYGIHIFNAAQEHIIGGDMLGEVNTISGNLVGVVITGTGTISNTVIGNFIGTNPMGTLDRGNTEDGVRIGGGAANNRVGGDTAGERNLISGNDDYGVYLTGSTTMNNTISGNYIGVQVNGTAALGNRFGVVLRGAANNTIGGTQPGQGNLVSGNTFDGIYLHYTGTNGNTIAGNFVGTDYTGTVALENRQYGISIVSQANNNTIGPGNLVSGNRWDGIMLRDVSGTLVYSNIIGTDLGGTLDLGNGENGLQLEQGANINTVGPGNLIAYNNNYGVFAVNNTTIQNTITQNSIFSNTGPGIHLADGAHNDILAPVIISASPPGGNVTISGTSYPDCTVEVFSSPTGDGEGQVYLGTSVANTEGLFTLTIPSPLYPFLTATATRAADGTSEFSQAFIATYLHLPLILR